MTQKLTRATRMELTRAIAYLERVQKYLASDRIAICNVDSVATTTLHFTRAYVPGLDKSEADARPLYRVAKDIGSDLAVMPDALKILRRLVNSED